MNTIKIRSFNAYRAEKFGYKLTAIDKLIMLRSKLHTHTELQFSLLHNKLSFSATMADNAKCCRFKDIKYSNPLYWDTIDLEVSDNEEIKIYYKCKYIENKPYDLIGLLSFLNEDLNWVKPSDTGYWCSEAVATAISEIPRFKDMILGRPDQQHPTKFDTILRGFQQKEVVK